MTRLIRFVLCLTAAYPSLALAGGWTQPAGEAYAKLWYRGLFGESVYGANGVPFVLPDAFRDQAINLYAELGLLDWLTLVVRANPFGAAAFGDATTTYMGRSALGLRAGMALGETRLAFQAEYGVAPAIGDAALVADVNADGKPFVYAPTVATQSVSGEAQIGHPLPFGWLAASVGLRGFSNDSIDPAVIGFGQLGYTASKALSLDVHANLNEPLGDVVITNIAGAGQTRYLGWGLGVSWWFVDAVSVTAGFEGVVYAESNAATPALTIGFESRGRLWRD